MVGGLGGVGVGHKVFTEKWTSEQQVHVSYSETKFSRILMLAGDSEEAPCCNLSDTTQEKNARVAFL